MRNPVIESIRRKIEQKDREIVRLLNERACLSLEVGRVKGREGIGAYDPARESIVLQEIAALNEGPLAVEALGCIYREILSSSRALQAPLAIAFLGPEGSFAHLAALGRFGRNAGMVTRETIGAVFDAVEKGKADLGLVPLENSLEGPVRITLERLITTPLAIRAEIFLRVSHCLMSRVAKAKIRRVYSHPQALAQCRQWLAKNLPQALPVEAESTSAAVLRTLKERQAGAIGSRLASEIHGLPIVEEGIEDHPSNATHFIVIGKGANGTTGSDKTSILFSTPHKPGALHAALAPFAKAGINLLRIESHPAREGMWQYHFFVDFEGHASETIVKSCLKSLGRRAATLKILGSYPREEATL